MNIMASVQRAVDALVAIALPRVAAAAACREDTYTVCAGACPGSWFAEKQYDCYLLSNCREICTSSGGCCL
ncbi:hypothetical protein ABZ907_20665 [Nonomuraea wenchangensis]